MLVATGDCGSTSNEWRVMGSVGGRAERDDVVKQGNLTLQIDVVAGGVMLPPAG